ncbi:hypothetical protein EfsSVR2281_09710 [Enterococcus faecalis]|nr:hypothetical protein EfsSVR2281_09710 [Enterococcus faecalis]
MYTLDQILRLLHPIMPFVTEEIWEKIPHQGESLVVAEYPVVHEEFNDEAASSRNGSSERSYSFGSEYSSRSEYTTF